MNSATPPDAKKISSKQSACLHKMGGNNFLIRPSTPMVPNYLFYCWVQYTIQHTHHKAATQLPPVQLNFWKMCSTRQTATVISQPMVHNQLHICIYKICVWWRQRSSISSNWWVTAIDESCPGIITISSNTYLYARFIYMCESSCRCAGKGHVGD